MDPVPTLKKVFATVSREERRRSIVRSQEVVREAVGFAVQAGRGTVGGSNSQGRGRGSDYVRPSCTYCGKLGHVFERCYERIGFPQGSGRGCGRGRGQGRGDRVQHNQQPIGVLANAATVDVHSDAPGSAATTYGNRLPIIPSLSSDMVQRLMMFLEASPSTDRLSGPQFEDSDWSG